MRKTTLDSKALKESAHALQLKAEALCKVSITEILDASKGFPSCTNMEIMHQLQVHQIELELQNEELLHSQNNLKVAKLRYKELYDRAPAGYCTLNASDIIIENNLYTNQLLDRLGQYLVGQKLTDFIHPDDQDIYYLHSRNLHQVNAPRSCELRMIQSTGQPIWVTLNQTLVETNSHQPLFYLAISDISKRKAMQFNLDVYYHNTSDSLRGDNTIVT